MADGGRSRRASCWPRRRSATPQDAPPRLAACSREADVVAAEDTRRLRRLPAALGVEVGRPGRQLPRAQRGRPGRPSSSRPLAGGATVFVVTDAGMPGVSDPGFRVVAAAVERGAAGHGGARAVARCSRRSRCRACRPTGSASRASCRASRASGPGRSRCWPRSAAPWSSSRRRTGWAAPSGRWPTAFGADRPAAVCRELTKTYEEIVRGPLGELAAWASADQVRGEIVVVVGGGPVEAGASTAAVAEVLSRAGRRRAPEGRGRGGRRGGRRAEARPVRRRRRRAIRPLTRPLSHGLALIKESAPIKERSTPSRTTGDRGVHLFLDRRGEGRTGRVQSCRAPAPRSARQTGRWTGGRAP